MPAPPDRLDRILDFLSAASALKDTFRSARTRTGLPESVAAHSWSLGLLAVLLEDDLHGVDVAHVLKLILVHDLGEAISGDVPAILQDPQVDKSAQERADLATLTADLPTDLVRKLSALWEEYEAGATPEATLAKGLDKIETMAQHVSGQQVPEFDYLWNLGYGTQATARTELLRALRSKVDARTRAKATRGQSR